MSKYLLSSFLLFVLSSNLSFAQYNQSVLLEHFTNTNCSVCGFRNPDLFTNLDREANADVIHVSFYPSRPYADCKLNNHNVSENDNRAKYHGLFGSTPQISINGTVPNRPSFDDNRLFEPFLGKESSFSVSSTYEVANDSLYTRIKLESNVEENWEGLALVVLAVEDTVFYKGRNSEKEHYNVFRRSFTGIEPTAFIDEMAIGDSAIAYFSLPVSADWDLDRMYTVAFLQNVETNEVVQVAKGVGASSRKPVSIKNAETNPFQLGISANGINFIGAASFMFQIFSIDGQLVKRGVTSNSNIAIDELNQGIYLLKIVSITDGLQQSFKFLKE